MNFIKKNHNVLYVIALLCAVGLMPVTILLDLVPVQLVSLAVQAAGLCSMVGLVWLRHKHNWI